MLPWIDTHCHLDASPSVQALAEVRERAAALGVRHCVIPAVAASNFEVVRQLAHQYQDSYALGIHPLHVGHSGHDELHQLEAKLAQYRDDPRLVAVGEIGLDFFVPEGKHGPARERQEQFYLAQLKLARLHQLPVILHVRRSADQLLKGLRALAGGRPWQGIAHAFNGSEQQAQAFIALGFKLGFGGALTYARALQLRRLASTLPLASIVLETDSPDMPPCWLYKTVAQREAGDPQARNEPGELPRIGAELAALRGMPVAELAQACHDNALQALPRLRALLA